MQSRHHSSSPSVRVRFAPSPTGYLHVGNMRAALINWLFARKHNGHFCLRLDDTDRERSKDEYAHAIFEDIAWLGLSYDHTFKQSDRMARYTDIVKMLRDAGRLYACYETPEELEFKRKRQLGRGEPPRYDRTGLTLTQAEKERFEKEGRTPHYRFLLSDANVSWVDMVRDNVSFAPHHLSDPVLVRADGAYLYTLTSVVDDVDEAITHILRGEDHVTNTAVQIQLIAVVRTMLGLNHSPIIFGHTTLLMDKDGGGLSKRLGSLSIGDLREQGIEPLAILSLLARLGTSKPIELFHTLDDIIEQFDITTFGRNAPRFDADVLHQLTHQHRLRQSADDIKDYLIQKGIKPFSDDEWALIKGNIDGDEDFLMWDRILHSDTSVYDTAHLTEDDRAYLKHAHDLIPAAPFTTESWGVWTTALKHATGRKGKSLFLPLRRALTGMDKGPEMKDILPLLTRETVHARLVDLSK